MQVFKIREDGFKEIQKLVLTRTIPLLLITFTAALFLLPKKPDAPNILPFYIPVVILMVSISIYRGIKRRKKIFDSYTLTITNNLVTREQFNTATISIYFNDIIEIARHKNGGFSIKGKDAADLIGIPAQVANYAQLEAALQAIQPIVVKDKVPFLQKYPAVIGLVTIGLMVCVYRVNNKIIVGLAGSLLVTLMIWSLVKIQSSKNVDSRTKKSAWIVLIVLASVIGVMILKLTGFAAMQKQ